MTDGIWYWYRIFEASDAGVKTMPYIDIHKLGFEYDGWESHPIAESIRFHATKQPDVIPEYIVRCSAQ